MIAQRLEGDARAAAWERMSQGLAELSRSTGRGLIARDQGVHAHARTLMTGLTTRRAAARHLATPRSDGRPVVLWLFDKCAHGRWGSRPTHSQPGGGACRGSSRQRGSVRAANPVGGKWSWPKGGAGTEIEVSDAGLTVRTNGLPRGIRRGLPGLTPLGICLVGACDLRFCAPPRIRTENRRIKDSRG